MMGAGKTTVGRSLRSRLEWEWVDTDECIQNRYGKISDIFATLGEEKFREMETEVVRGLSEVDNRVISVGGGLVLKDENVRLLKQNGMIVYLRAEKKTLAARLRADTERPLLQTGEESIEKKLDRMLALRAPVYERVADRIVDVDGKTPQEIAEEIERCIFHKD